MLLLIVALSFLGFADATYLTADHYLRLPLPCTTAGGCETVLTSRYAMVGPIPLAAIGILYYLAILFLAMLAYTSNRGQPRAVKLVLGIVVAGLVASLFLFYLQVFVIHSLCTYCLGSAMTTFILAVLSVLAHRLSVRYS
ncbi:MAG: vitamin K epoxide reductase family protein [Patescibacteria group bacterium]|nr:vitamin K epoxide reductase family protein [Patescibacteria group bacterium]